MRDLDLTQYPEADRREADPPIEAGSATRSAAGELDWWVKKGQEWFGRARGFRRTSSRVAQCATPQVATYY